MHTNGVSEMISKLDCATQYIMQLITATIGWYLYKNYNGYMFGNTSKEEFEDTKGVIRISISKNTMVKRKSTNGQTMI